MTIPPKPTKADRAANVAAMATVERQIEALKAESERAYAAKREIAEEAQRFDVIERMHKLPAEIVAALANPTPPANLCDTLKRRELAAPKNYFDRSFVWTHTAQMMRRILGVGE